MDPWVWLHLTGPTVPDPLPARGRVRCHHVSRRREHSAKIAGGPGPPTGSRTPIHYLDPSAGREQTPRLGGGSGTATCPQAQVRARVPSFLGKTWPPTAFITRGVKCALPQQSPRRLSPGYTDRALPRCTVQPLVPLTPRTSVCYTS